jgi:hypothetical protein
MSTVICSHTQTHTHTHTHSIPRWWYLLWEVGWNDMKEKLNVFYIAAYCFISVNLHLICGRSEGIWTVFGVVYLQKMTVISSLLPSWNCWIQEQFDMTLKRMSASWLSIVFKFVSTWLLTTIFQITHIAQHYKIWSHRTCSLSFYFKNYRDGWDWWNV